MKKNIALLLLTLFYSVLGCGQNNLQNFYQNINVAVSITETLATVTDSVLIPAKSFNNNENLKFELNKHLKIMAVSSNFELITDSTDNFSSYYHLQLKAQTADSLVLLVLSYSGIISDEIKEGAVMYARGFSETSGTINDKGVYMSASTVWLPAFQPERLSSFDLNVKIDSAWNVVSQGERVINKIEGNQRIVKYHSPEPMDEVYLIAARWKEYNLMAGNVLVQAFLRTPDDELANRYLGMTSQYLDLYEKLIGPYPFTKFALVENFWETGYGMPSFTLLGEKVIRFPWILYSSYPHELLHNYWGNSVFVAYGTGNWCEGITAYMADHLLQEQQGKGASYRRSTLQKFTDYVNEENDFPVNKFLNRNNSAEEAIGYGKVLMMNNMLRCMLGDQTFVDAYSKFYTDNKFRKASFGDIEKSFEQVSGKDLSPFFNQWVNRTGAPSLQLSDVAVKNKKKQYTLSFKLSQTQKEDVFALDVPVYVYFDNDSIVEEQIVTANQRQNMYTLTFNKKPVRIDIDPEFQVMRRLSRQEVPTTLTQIFGEKQSMIVLPSDTLHAKAYGRLAEMWKKTQEAQGNEITIVTDKELTALPNDKAVWVLGFNNKFNVLNKTTEKFKEALGSEKLDQINELQKNGAVVFASTNLQNANQTLGFIGANDDKAIDALSGKLLHYGKYSFLGFTGAEATNVLKGELPAMNSPLNFVIDPNAVIIGKIAPRKSLDQTTK
jgi:hypothetical protein